MNSAVSINSEKSAYQIKREKAGARGRMLSLLLLLVILAANVDNVMADTGPELRVVGLGYDLSSVKTQMNDSTSSIEYISFAGQNKLDMKTLRQSDIVVQEGIDDLGSFFNMVNELNDTIVVVVGDSLIGQGLMLDNLIVTDTFVARETLVALLKMKEINPRLTHAQLMHGLFGENVYDQIALDRSGKVMPVDIESAVNYATALSNYDTEAPRLITASSPKEKRLKAKYEDNQGVSYVEMYIDDKFVSRDYDAPFEFDLDENTNRRVSLVAYDSAANSSRMEIK
ncbi:MAG: hypothetical protein OEX19_15950 [Gammaproteobacteria bacterium]|nr:hypothetical protein [Gammaproteobacteria bacterium]